jgi:hypothetical protein
MNPDTRRACEGWCGGYVSIKNTRTLRDGTRVCQECYEKVN